VGKALVCAAVSQEGFVTDTPTTSAASTEGPDHTYTFSDAYLAQRRRLTIGVIAVIAAAPFLILIVDPLGLERLFALAPFLLLVDVAVIAGGLLVTTYMSRQLRRTRLVVGSASFTREAGTARDVVVWGDVTTVRVRHDRANIPTLVEVFRTGGHRLQLFGFDGMMDLVSDFRAHIPQTTSFVSKPQRAIESSEPAVRIAFVAAVFISGIALNLLLPRVVMNRFTAVLNLGIGVWVIAVRPMSRANPGFRRLDLVLGLLLLGGAWQISGFGLR
jgi:hypothetical protein